jgi:hypothetical protein
MENFVNDEIIGNKMFFLSLEIVTYEASNEYYTYSAVLMELNDNGKITTSLDIASLDINKYTEWYHWLRMILELVFLLLIFYMIYKFIRKKIEIIRMYNKWYFREIDYLSQSEKNQRFKYEPEIIRKFKAAVDFFTIFEFLFLIFALVLFIMWLVFITKYQKLKDNHNDSNRNEMYNNFYEGKELFDSYKIILALASI